MRRPLALPLLFAGVLLSLAACTPAAAPDRTEDGRRLVWSDEFAGSGPPDTTRWAYDTGGHGWGNRELQFYTAGRPANARRADGHLIIEAHREARGDNDYTSARLVTRGRRSWTYGRFEVRARVPSGRGTWPAIWMLGENIDRVGWPRCGEIDIMEHVGYNPDSVFATTHTEAFNHVNGRARSGGLRDTTLETDFHVYAIDWRPDRIDFYYDDRHYHEFRRPAGAGPAEWPFDQPQYLLLNLAVGGAWGGRRGVDSTGWPRRFAVDYVRVYQ